MPHGWPCWALSNHDVRRAVTRWGGDTPHRCWRAAIAGAGVLAARFGLPVPGRGTGPGRGRRRLSACRIPTASRSGPASRAATAAAAAAVERRAQRRLQQRRAMAAGGCRIARSRSRRRNRIRIRPCTRRAALRWRKSQPALVHGAIRFSTRPTGARLRARTTASACCSRSTCPMRRWRGTRPPAPMKRWRCRAGDAGARGAHWRLPARGVLVAAAS